MDINFVKVGKWGSCLWGISEDGELFINEGQAETVTSGEAPWADSAETISSATAIGHITFPENASLAGLFKGCVNLEKADLTGFVTDNVTDMRSMFEGCVSLKELDLTSFDTRRCSNMNGMFRRCANLSDILIGEDFSVDGDGTTSCGRLAVKEHGKYRRAKTISAEGFSVIYHSNLKDEEVEERQTIPNNSYEIEDVFFSAPGEGSVFIGWNTSPDGKGQFYYPGKELEQVYADMDLYAIWAWPPEVGEIRDLPSFTYGEKIPFELPEITSVNGSTITGYLEISATGEEGSWHAINHDSILPVAFNGYLVRLHASNNVGEAVSNAVRLKIHKASIDTSAVRWEEEPNMVYNGEPKKVRIEGLPSTIGVSYEDNVAVDAGTYVARCEFDYDDKNINEPLIVKEYEWTIRKASLDMSQVHWDYQNAFTYDGHTKEVRLVGLPDNVNVIYDSNEASDTGVYTATASLVYDYDNYEKPADIVPCVWEIKKAVVDANKLRWSGYEDFVYDGMAKGVSIVNLPEDAVVEYDGAVEVLAGKYLARATLVGNYIANGPIEYEWEIKRDTYDLSDVRWSMTRSFGYDGETHGITLHGVPEPLQVRYTNNQGTSVGKYLARAIFMNPDTHNYVTPDDMTMTWEITRKVVDMSGVHWDYSEAFTYDGENKSVKLVGLPENIRASYTGNSAFNAGEYFAHAILLFDEDNLEVEQPADCQWKINKKKIDVSGAYWDYTDAFVYDGTEHGVYLEGVPEGLKVDYSDNAKTESGVYTASATLTPSDTVNYESAEVSGCIWAIRKAERTVSGIEWTDSKDFVYDGKEKTVGIISELDGDIKVDYEGSKAVNAGRYYAKAAFSLTDDSNYIPPKPVGYSWNIAKARYDMSAVYWDYDGAFTYDGTVKTVKLNNVPEGIIVKYKNESKKDAGTYKAVAHFEVQDENNYETQIPDVSLEWTINKAVFDMSEVRWQGEKAYAYDGEEKGHDLRLSGLPDGLIPVYEGNSAVLAGRYTAKADFEYDEVNYEKPEIAPCHWVIEKSALDISTLKWDYDEAFVYDGSEKHVFISDVPEGAKVEYSNAGAVNAGTYVAAAEIVPDDTANRVKSRLENLTWRIERGEYDMSHAYWDYEKAIPYDGREHKVVVKGLPGGVTPEYTGNTATDSGTYRASVSFKVADAHNYNVPVMEDLEWTVSKADYDMSGVTWDYDGAFTYSGRMYEITLRGLPDGVRAIYTGNAAADTGSYEASAELIPYDQDNYNRPVVDTCKWRIGKADYEMSAVRWDYESSKVFNGRPQSVMLEHLPNGVSAEYFGNEATDVGSYTARAELSVSDSANFNVPAVSNCDWEISRAQYDLSKTYWDYTDGKFTYDGTEKTVELMNLPEGLRVNYSGNSASFAGKYTATARFETDDPNFEEPEAITLDWSIDQAEYDMSEVRWDYDRNFIFDGSVKKVEVTGLREGISVVYTNNTAVDAGTYTATAHFKSETDNYRDPDEMFCTWVIDKADIDIRRVAWDYSQSFTYDGLEKRVELRGVPDLLEVSYIGNTAEKAGQYTAQATLTPLRPENYNTPYIRECTWEILKADYDMSSARWEGEFEYTYDGSEKGIFIEGLPEGVTAVYHDSSAVNAGSYVASAELICDTDNYNVPSISECSWVINKGSYDMSGLEWYADDKIVYDGEVKSVKLKGVPEGLTPVYTENSAINAGEYEATVEFEYDENNYEKPEFHGCKWHIAPADIEIDLSSIRWDYSEPFVYDGLLKSVHIAEAVQDQGLFDRLRGRRPSSGLAGIPEGFDVIYQNNEADQAGVYYASARIVNHEDSGNYNDLVLPPFKWEIAKAKVDLSNVRWNYEGSFTYDGEEKRIELLGLPRNTYAEYTDNTGTDAGDHEAMAVIGVTDTDNYEIPGPVSGCWWHIEKASYDMSNVYWSYEDDLIYDGNEKSVRLVGLPDGVSVDTYKCNKAVDAGNYTAEAFVTYQNKENFKEPIVPTLKWRIHKKKIDLSHVTWNYDDSTLFVFDDQPKEVRLAGLPDEVDVVYIDNRKINAGTYTARARLVYDTRNCEVGDVPDLSWRIEKATFDTNSVHWTYDMPFRYDGSEKSIFLVGVPAAIAVRYRDNKASAIGTYTAKAYLTYDSDNYEAPEIDTMIDWSIISNMDY